MLPAAGDEEERPHEGAAVAGPGRLDPAGGAPAEPSDAGHPVADVLWAGARVLAARVRLKPSGAHEPRSLRVNEHDARLRDRDSTGIRVPGRVRSLERAERLPAR